VICTLGSGSHRELAQASAEASSLYGQRHGWDVVACYSVDLAAGRPPSWAKIPLVLNLLDTYEWVWWIDADAIIVDLDRDVMADIDASEGAIWLARHPQERREEQSVLNAGVFLVRRDARVIDFLNAVWNAEQFIDHNWWENAAILHLLGYSLTPPYGRVSESIWTHVVSELDLAWNTVPGYIDHDRPANHHHARADHDSMVKRIEAMRDDLEAVRGRA
jgi:hypothetical protein